MSTSTQKHGPRHARAETAELNWLTGTPIERRPDGSPRADIAFLTALDVLSASMYLRKRRALPFLIYLHVVLCMHMQG
jgi:hypothetical protein